HGPDGHLYTKYFPGNIFGVALIYKLTAQPNDQPYVWARELASSATGASWALRVNALWGAIGMTSLLFLLKRYFDWRTAIATVLLIGICSDWWYQSRGLFSEVGRSEERRVGKECRSGWSAYDCKKIEYELD